MDISISPPVHCDIKDTNVLAYKVVNPRTGQIRLGAKIADLGEVKNLSTPINVVTNLFAAPELFMDSRDATHPLHQQLHKETKEFYYGYECYQNLLGFKAPKNQSEAKKHHDIWAFGIFAYSVIYGHPSWLQVDNRRGIAEFKQRVGDIQLLEKMLNPYEDERISIEQVISELEVKIQTLERDMAFRQRFQV